MDFATENLRRFMKRQSRQSGNLPWIIFLSVLFFCGTTSGKAIAPKSVFQTDFAPGSAMAASAKPEDCDWTGITKRSILADGSVQQEYLRCSSGRITWLYPEGALRITIHSPHHLHPSNNNNNNMKTPSSRHRVCLTVTDPHFLQGVNVYLQQDNPKPRLVFSTSPKKTPSTIPIPNGNSSDRKCFIQTSSVVTVYMESYLVEGLNFIPASSSGKGDHHLRTRVPSIGATEILYDIQAL